MQPFTCLLRHLSHTRERTHRVCETQGISAEDGSKHPSLRRRVARGSCHAHPGWRVCASERQPQCQVRAGRHGDRVARRSAGAFSPSEPVAQRLSDHRAASNSAHHSAEHSVARFAATFDPTDYPGTGVAGGLQNGDALGDSQVYTAAVVEEGPALLSPPPPYPELLRRAGIAGRVLLQAIVDTAGRVEPNSVKILKSSSPGFAVPTRRWALAARFRPARLQGRAVRVLVNLPVDFTASNPGPGG
jgi:TonB family protein